MQNRAQRRANRRRLTAALRDSGCTCTPEISTDQSIERGLPNARETGTVVHRVGCPLLPRLAALTRPVIVFKGVGPCERR